MSFFSLPSPFPFFGDSCNCSSRLNAKATQRGRGNQQKHHREWHGGFTCLTKHLKTVLVRCWQASVLSLIYMFGRIVHCAGESLEPHDSYVLIHRPVSSIVYTLSFPVFFPSSCECLRQSNTRAAQRGRGNQQKHHREWHGGFMIKQNLGESASQNI